MHFSHNRSGGHVAKTITYVCMLYIAIANVDNSVVKSRLQGTVFNNLVYSVIKVIIARIEEMKRIQSECIEPFR